MPTSTILNADLAAATVTYNGVQFGGADSTLEVAIDGDGESVFLRSTPPMYELRSNFRYDEQRVNVIGIDHVLTVRTWVYQNNEVDMGRSMAFLRSRLGQAGKELKILGMGTGFGDMVYSGSPDYVDLENGPHPLNMSLVPISDICWELTWTVSYFTSECFLSETTSLQAWISFSFTTTWANDFEGITTRNISGSVKTIQIRPEPDTAGSVKPFVVADAVRDNVQISIPPNFRRIRSEWNESSNKANLTFNVVDEYLPGDDLPTGMTLAKGSLTFTAQAGSEGGSTMVQGVVTLDMTLKSSLNIAKAKAAEYFIICALGKQKQLTFNDDGTIRTRTDKGAITVLPLHFAMRNEKFDDSRVTTASISWLVINDFWTNLNSSKLFEGFNDTVRGTKNDEGDPVLGSQNYIAWRAEMAKLWGNRGVSGIGSSVTDAEYINLCNTKESFSIGNTGSVPRPVLDVNLPTLSCPQLSKDDTGEVLPGAGWLHYKLELEPYRIDYNGTHKRAVIPEVSAPSDPQGIISPGNDPNPAVYNDPAQAHISERQGLPVVYVAVKFAGLRYGVQIPFPELKTYGGVRVDPIKDSIGTVIEPDTLAFDSFGCKVYKRRGYQIYRLRGVPSNVSFINNPKTYSNPLDTTVPLEL